MTIASTTFNVTVSPYVPPPPGEAPAWWADAGFPPRTWKTVAATATLDACIFTPTLSTTNNYGDRNIINDYSGATVDQARREMLMVANGGHADYLGNEGYALALWAEQPYWYRLNDPSPVSVMYYPVTSGTSPAVHMDGRCPAMHTYGIQTHAKGRVWFSLQGHVSSGAGSWINGLMSFSREAVGMPYNNTQAPLAWVNNIGPWTNLGPVNNNPHSMASAASNQWSPAASVYDPIGEHIYTINPQAPDLAYIKLNVNTGQHNCYVQRSLGTAPDYIGQRAAPVMIDDRALNSATNGVILHFNLNSSTVTLLSCPLLGQDVDNACIEKVTGPSANAPTITNGGAAVYHNGAIYYMNWAVYGSTIFKLTVPADVNGDWSNAWSIEAAHAGNPAEVQALIPVGAFSGNGQWSKFNIVRDMGNGQAALVCASAYNGATSIYKVT